MLLGVILRRILRGMLDHCTSFVHIVVLLNRGLAAVVFVLKRGLLVVVVVVV
jgi:hypothetical protein